MKKVLTSLFLALCAICTPLAAQEWNPPSAFGFGAAQRGPSTSVAVFSSADNIPAGESFTLLARITMKPHWHVYWKNPGEAGMPLSIEWNSVPAGVTLGQWRWSQPKYYALQGLGSYVYEDVAYVEIPVTLAQDLPAGALALSGTASWLACDDNGCYPEEARVNVKFNVLAPGSERIPVNPPLVFADAQKLFPKSGALSLSYTQNAGSVTVTVKGDAAQSLSEAARFFPESAKFSTVSATAAPVVNNGALSFTLTLNEGETIENPSDVAGVLISGTGESYEVLPGDNSAAGADPVAEFSFDLAFLGLLALAFAGGLILNLMPCVFPVLGLKIMHFVGKSGEDKSKIARHGFVFGAGVLISFWVLAGILVALRSGGEQLGWGFQLQEPGFVYGMILLMLVFGLSMSGVFEFGTGATSVGGSLTEKSGYAGSFFSGVLAVIIATPCAAPFLAPALGSALALPPVPSFSLFTAIAVGLAAPYVILSCVPALLKFLPKPGAWMETFKQAMAFLLYAPALYFAWVLLGQIEDPFAQRDLLISFAVIALACWIYGRWAVAWRSRLSRITGTLVALVLFVGTIFYCTNLIYGEKEDEWVAWSPAAQAAALEDGKIVYIDFTARWCATCQVNKAVYSNDTLQAEFKAANVVKMRADWTNKDATIASELRKYGRAAVPVNVFLKKDKAPVILGELFAGPGTVSAGLEEIKE